MAATAEAACSQFPDAAAAVETAAAVVDTAIGFAAAVFQDWAGPAELENKFSKKIFYGHKKGLNRYFLSLSQNLIPDAVLAFFKLEASYLHQVDLLTIS